ncbi:MAG: hypothetical protein QM539_08400 [Alphaproteobacteria bacterium]|nr:hypothetical protein [Alphaproteobacteria bacterium]
MTKKENNKSLIISLVIVVLALIGFVVFHIVNNNEIEDYFNNKVNTLTQQKEALHAEFILVSNKVDSLKGINVDLNEKLDKTHAEISFVRAKLQRILKKEILTQKELDKARAIVKDFTKKTEALHQNITELQLINQQQTSKIQELTQSNSDLNSQNEAIQKNIEKLEKEKAEIKDIASTMHASFFKLTAIRQKKNGRISETSSHNAINYFLVEFNIDDNPLAEPGNKELYVIIKDPTNKIINENNVTFQSRTDGEKLYTDKIIIDYERGKTTPVKYTKHLPSALAGVYFIQVYQNGFKIGEAKKLLD